ncbi:MAG TPA: cell division protein FtsL [Acidobacteriaceae bacterium]|nr:cell division protein FtsL [Acidobacteriaceae bacterium]
MATIPMAGQAAMFGTEMGRVSNPSQARAQRNRELFELQRRARRGPTPEVFFAKHIDNSRIVKADDPERRREMRSFTRVMSILFVLVMVYVWQHFSAIEVGYHVETQKQQVAALQEQNRQLRLQEAEYSNPVRIDQIARQLGLDAPRPGQMVRPDGSASTAPVLAQASAPALPVD